MNPGVFVNKTESFFGFTESNEKLLRIAKVMRTMVPIVDDSEFETID
ncbi:MAG: hypothetical protein ACW98Y_11445 [Candidatus Thorarchaeota archaeon]|jgi:hypothetical protein